MIPLATTTITVLRAPTANAYDEPYGDDNEPDDWDVVTSGVRAVIDRPTGREQVAGGQQSTTDLELVCDPCDIDYRDRVRDERTTAVYEVRWSLDYGPHIEAGLRIVEGVV